VAARLGTDVRGAAAAAIRLAVANIVRAIQLVSTERGRDPRDYALLPFGGAGPLLAAEIAEELGIPEILVPPNPGVISALGLLSADYVKVYGATRRMRLDAATPDAVREEYTRFRGTAEQEFRDLGLDGPYEFSLEADMRFVGQAFEIPVPVDTAGIAGLGTGDLAERFTAAHRRVYLHGGEPGRQVELVGLRFGVRRRLEALPETRERPTDMARPAQAEVTIASGRAVQARIIAAAALAPDDPIAGPALIEGYSSTTWVPKGWRARRDRPGNLLLTRDAA
jgi:N-methylhydantoinase A